MRQVTAKRHSPCLPTALALLALVLAAIPAAGQTVPPATSGGGGGGGAKAIAVAEAVAALPADVKTPHRYALIIGASQYDDPRIPALPACAQDAKALDEVLTNPAIGMFADTHVWRLVGADVTRVKIVDALDKLARKAGPDDLVLVFFSGHGATDERGRAYWVMADTRIDKLRATALLEQDVSELLGEVKTRRLVTLIDACYSAATANLQQTKSLLDLNRIYPRFQGEGRVAITASRGDQLSVVIKDPAHPGHGYSAFAWQVIQGLKGAADTGDHDGVITVNELWTYVKDRTETTARQQGGRQQPQLKGQLGSRFLLAIDADRLARNLRETAEAKARRAQRLKIIEQLYFDEKLTLNQTQLGQRLLKADSATLDEYDRKRLKYFQQVADGRLAPDTLQRALDLVETPSQRAARLQREAAALAAAQREAAERAEKQRLAELERQKQQKIAELLATAKASDSKEQGKTALAALDALLRLDPNHWEAKRLRDKISAYYGPSKIGETITNSIGMKLTYIPAGEFLMGSPAGESERSDDETQHRVKISKPFLLQTTEVTQGQWKAVMGSNPSGFKGSDDLPVEQVSWEDAVAFCRKLSEKEGRTYRLPTESEWEYACRAGTTTRFSFGDSDSALGSYGWYGYNQGNANKQTHAVGQKKANAWGLYDMHGNVYEWCSDWYDEDYPTGLVTDPTGPSTGSQRVLRGGCWVDFPWHCRSANRNGYAPDFRINGYGFRVLLDLSGNP